MGADVVTDVRFADETQELTATVPEDNARTRARDALVVKLGEEVQSTSQTPANTETEPEPAVTEHEESVPLGDGRISTSQKQGFVFSCQQNFRAGGALPDGPWIRDGNWYPNEKVAVGGQVRWTNDVLIQAKEGMRLITANGLPNHTTGVFPISVTDIAYRYDRNPNSIKVQDILLLLPLSPTIASLPSCVPMGMIGVGLNGVAIYNALDDAGKDAVAHEVQDNCDAHPQSAGTYHYHGPSDCMPHANELNALIGYALDGFGIFSGLDSSGKEYTNADLDECHGLTSEIMWDGKILNMYHYVLTREYPYTLGCFKGIPVEVSSVNELPHPPPSGPDGLDVPPPPGNGANGQPSPNL